MKVPEIRYARSADGLSIAYQVFGSGPPVLVVPPLLSNIELSWEHDVSQSVNERLAANVTVIQFDKRGIGCSDRFEAMPTLEQRIGDISAVLDHAGYDRVSLVGLSEGGLMSQLFAVEHPDRVDRVVLVNSAPGRRRGVRTMSPEHIAFLTEFFGELVDSWGRRPEHMIDAMMPSRSGDESYIRFIGRMQRQSAAPADMRRQVESVLSLGAPADLAKVAAPTLVVHSSGDRIVPKSESDHLVRHIPNAEYDEIDGDDHFFWVMSAWRDPVDRQLEFITGRRPAAMTQRRFATVLFTDLVGSTARSAAAGDSAWSETRDGHDRVCTQIVNGSGGTLIKSTGDGILATFESPSAAVAAARALRRHLGAMGLPIRAGLHTGEVEVHADGDISGLAVNLAARVEQAADDGTVFASSTVRDMLLGGDHVFEDRGDRTLKGFDGNWKLYEVTG